MNAVTVINQKDKFYTNSGMLRIRWWPFAAIGVLGGLYAALNLATFAMIVAGAKGQADVFFHLPLFLTFGQ